MIQHDWLQQKTSAFSIKARFKSFAFAWNGILRFFQKEHNAQLHLAASLVVMALAFFLKVSSTEVLFLLFSISFVWVSEMINTAIEKIMDFICFEKNKQIKLIKDLAAGAVLVASVTALIAGCIIFIPKLLLL